MKARALLPGLVILMMSLTACGPPEAGIEQTATPAPSPSLPGPLLTPTSTVPTPIETPLPSDLPPGLVFANSSGLWWVGKDGRPFQLLDRSDVLLSPNGAQGLYASDGDLWLIELSTGSRRDLTNTPDRLECCPQWWPARPETIIFGSWPSDVDLGPSTGFLTTVQVDGSGYRVLDDESPSNAPPAPAPDGQTIAYDRGGTAYLYRWGAGPIPFDPAAYGLPVQKIGSPSWSPDGKRLAWVAGGDFGQGWQLGLGLFDLEARTAHLLHPFEPRGVGGWPGAAVWIPDGEWLAYPIWPAADPNEEGIYVFHAEGMEEHCLGPGGGPVWSPDGRWLAFYRESGIWLVEVGKWNIRQAAADVWPVAWLEPAQEDGG